MDSMTNMHLASRFMRAPSLVSPHHTQDIITLGQSGERNAEATLATEKTCAAGMWEANFGTNGKSFIFAGGVAVIPVYGVLLHRDNWCTPWATGYDYIASRLQAAAGDDEVTRIILDINSPGGQVSGNFELSNLIYELREKKGIYGLADARAMSGGYSILSACTKAYATDSAEIGSIGVVLMHMSQEEWMKDMGLKTTFIFAGKHKVDGNPYQDLPEDVKAAFQASVDRSYEKFVALVARNRGIEADAVRSTEAGVFEADEAKSLGLIDEVMSPRAAYAAIQSEPVTGSTQPKGKKTMTTENPEKGAGGEDTARITAEAKAAGAKEAQARISGILTCEEAAGKTKLANHIAFNSDMSVQDAKEMLKNAAAEVPAKKEGGDEEEGKSAKGAQPGPLAAAMAEQAGKTAGVDAPEGEDDGKPKKGAVGRRLANSFRKATGVKPRSQ